MNEIFMELKKGLQEFWTEQLRCTVEESALHIAYPLLMPDGWQLSFSLYRDTGSEVYELSDNGKIMDYLELYFPRITKELNFIIQERCKLYDFELSEKNNFHKLSTKKFPPHEIQLFAEGLISIAHLIYRFSRRTAYDNLPYETVSQIYISLNHPFESHVDLRGKYHNRIYADIKTSASIIRVLNTQRAFESLQIASFQFHDYKLANPSINRILIYNPDKNWDDDCLALAQSTDYFEFSAPYTESESIRDYIRQYDPIEIQA